MGGATVSALAGASTYALGEVFKKHFESGGTILDFDPERLKKYYEQKFEKGKTVAQDIAKEETPEGEEPAESILLTEEEVTKVPAVETEPEEKDILSKLKELGALKTQGIISEEEFETMKKKLIDKF